MRVHRLNGEKYNSMGSKIQCICVKHVYTIIKKTVYATISIWLLIKLVYAHVYEISLQCAY